MAGPGGAEVGRVSVRVVPDVEHFRSELRAALEKETAGLEVKIPVELDLDSDGIRQKVKAATAGLDEKINVKMDVDKGALDRLSSFAKSGNNFGGGGGLPLGAFADNLAVVAAVASIAAPALALVTGALATLPAVLAGVATPIGVIALGMDGIKKAAEQLSKPLADLKTSISGVFETRLTPVFGQLAQVLPKLDVPLQAVANGLSDVAKSFVDAITSGPGLARIQDTISNIASAISTAAPGIGSLTNGLLGLADGVSKKFPAVSKWFNEAADSFSRWVDKATADGSLDRAMGNLGDTLKGVLDIVGDLAKQGFNFLQDPKFGESMKTFVADVQSLVKDALPALKNFFMDLTDAIDGVVGAIDSVKGVVNGLPDWVKRENPTPEQSNDAGSKKGPAPSFGLSTDAPLVETLAPKIAQVQILLGQLWTNFKMSAATAITEVAGLFSNLSAAFANVQTVAATAWNGLVSTAANVVAQVIAQFSQIPGRIAGALGSIPGIVAGIFASAVAAVASAGAQMIAQIVSTGGQIAAEVASWGGKVASAAQSIAHALDGIGGQMIAGFLGGFRSAAAAAVGEVAAWAGKIAAAAKNALGIHSPSKVFNEIGANTAQGLQDGLEGGFQGVIERAKSLSQALTDAINGGLTGVDGTAVNDQIKAGLKELELQRKQLKVNQDAIPKEDKEGRKAIQGQMDQITALKDQLGLQKDQLGLAQDYGDQTAKNGDSNKFLTDTLDRTVGLGKNFAMANANQFMSDLGISGQGAIPTIGGMGLDFMTSFLGNLMKGGLQTNIQVNSVDEALSAKQTIDNRKALQYRQR